MTATGREPLFSVVVPTYDRPELLAHALESVLAQDCADFECIVVDDGSRRPPAVPDDRRFRVIRNERNGGPAVARNTGIDAARGRWLAFLDDDDAFTPDRLTLARRGLERAPIAVCWCRYMGETRGSGRGLSGDVSDTILDGLTPSLGATAVCRTLAPRFDTRFNAVEDVDWWIRLAARGTVETVPVVGYLVRSHGGLRHRNDLDARMEESAALMALHAGYFEAHPRAAAFRWKRIGLMALRQGDGRLARQALARSLRLWPQPRTAWHLARAARPLRHARVDSPVA